MPKHPPTTKEFRQDEWHESTRLPAMHQRRRGKRHERLPACGAEAERYAHLLKLPRLRQLVVWPAPDRLSSHTDFASVIVRRCCHTVHCVTA